MAFDAEVEAILAWAVREAATNVIRHSGARRCTVKITSGRDGAGVEVLDDGAGARFPAGVWSGTEAGVGVGVGVGVGQPPRAVNGHGGHGLAGLSERAESLHGRIEAGPLPDGGFRPAVSVPVTDR